MTKTPTPSPLSAFDFDRVRDLRQGAGMSMTQLGVMLWQVGATVIPATRQQIRNWETGHNHPNVATLRGLAEIFGVTMESFFKRAEN